MSRARCPRRRVPAGFSVTAGGGNVRQSCSVAAPTVSYAHKCGTWVCRVGLGRTGLQGRKNCRWRSMDAVTMCGDQFTINRAINLTKTIATIYRISVTERLIKFRKQSPDHSDRFTSFAVNVFHLASSSTSPQQPAGRYRDTAHCPRDGHHDDVQVSRGGALSSGKSAGDSGVKIPNSPSFWKSETTSGPPRCSSTSARATPVM